jgi:hypothetical protein
MNKHAEITEWIQTTDKLFTLNWLAEIKELSKITESPKLT